MLASVTGRYRLTLARIQQTQPRRFIPWYNRSLCEATVNGAKVLIFASINVNASRVAGTNGDQAIAYKSTDMGRNLDGVAAVQY